MRAFVGLGANLGDARATLDDALARIAALPQTTLRAASSLYRSAPVDADGPDFYNRAAEIDTGLAPRALLDALHEIERAYGRERPYRNAPRTLDLDLLLYGAQRVDEPDITLPHPRLHERAFVLAPLLELAPGLEHPALGPLAPWLERVADQAIEKLP